jgi:hypothetical protein
MGIEHFTTSLESSDHGDDWSSHFFPVSNFLLFSLTNLPSIPNIKNIPVYTSFSYPHIYPDVDNPKR